MADFVTKITSIHGGMKYDFSTPQEGTYLYGANIDPEGVSNSSSRINSTGYITPVQSTNFSPIGGKLSSVPMWILSPGRDTNVYTYGTNGQVTRYDLTLANETVLSASIGNSTGSGAVYYNDYLYFATSADIHRYGPLDSNPTATAMMLSSWTAATSAGQQGLSAICNYPVTPIGGLTWPNHPMHVHVDNKLYFGDYISATGTNKAVINYIQTNGDGTVMTGSRGALDLPFGYAVTDIESFGNDLAILAIPIGTYTSFPPKTGRAALFLWDTFSSSFYRQVNISDPVASAIINHNGELRVFASDVGQRYTRILGYTGGNSFRDLDYVINCSPPLAGAVDIYAGMLAYGSTNITGKLWTDTAGVMTFGTRNARLGPNSRHMIMSPQTIQTNPYVPAIAFVESTGKYPIMASTGSSGHALSKNASNTDMSVNLTTFITAPIEFGQEFEITKIRLVFDTGITANSTISLIAYVDDFSTTPATYTISNAVYSGKKIVDLGTTIKGNTNLALYFSFSGTQNIGIKLPITLWGRTLRDN